ncbi:MAG: N-6 DNA methylase, partial [Caldilineaceae bacterium]|nr:N-6 DNA methylase [Caldilineaceae bacterium]
LGIKTQLRHRQKLADALGKPVAALTPDDDPNPILLYGQELQADNVAAAKMNAFIHDMRADVRQGNTMRNPLFLNEDGSLRRFGKIGANPMWNQDMTPDVYENDAYGRFAWGTPPGGTADWGWVQHMYASLEPGGRMAVVLDTGAVSRGSGNKGKNAERDIRKQFVEHDAIDAVILLPDNMFFNTSAPGIILVAQKVDAGHARTHAGEILLINAGKLFVKGRPKNEMSAEQVRTVGDLYLNWRAEEELSAVVKVAEVVRNDYNLSPSRYVASNDVEPPLPLEEAVVLMQEAEEARAVADARLDAVMAALGFEDWREVA